MSSADFRLIRPVTLTHAMLTSSTVAEADATKWNAAGALPAGTVRMVVDTTGSPSVITHGIYELDVGGNSSIDPTTTAGAANWTLTGYTNRWEMFDESYQTQTTNADSIVVVIAPGEITNNVALLNAEGVTATILQSTSGYTETKSLIRHDVLSWYDWYYETPIATGDVVFTGIPPSSTDSLTITIDATGSTAKCGVCVVGKSKTVGATQWGLSRSINDYSQTSESATGSITLAQGGYSKRMNIEFKVQEGLESEATRVFEQFRATPLVFVGSTEYSMTIIYGYLGAWTIPIALDGRSANAEIKGLV